MPASTSRASQRAAKHLGESSVADKKQDFHNDIAQLAENGQSLVACARLGQKRGAHKDAIANLTRLVDLLDGEAKAAAKVKLILALEAPGPVLSPVKKKQKKTVDLTSDDSPPEASASAADLGGDDSPPEASASAANSLTAFDNRFTSAMMEEIFNCYKTEGIHDNGLSTTYVADRLRFTLQQVIDTNEFLLSEEHIYETIKDHYKSHEVVESL
jgi:hypothetical protein